MFRAFVAAALAIVLTACPGEDSGHYHADTGHRPDAPLGTTGGSTANRRGSTRGPVTGLSIVRSPTWGPYLTDASGRALYALEAGEAAGDACDGSCMAVWPAFLASAGPPVSTDSLISPRLIGVVQRISGAMQVTYSGHALHFYAGDTEAKGFTRGQHTRDSWGTWYLLRPNGELVGSGAP